MPKYYYNYLQLSNIICVSKGWIFVTLQEYIFTLLNRHQRLKELVFLIFIHLNTNTTNVLKNPSFFRK